MMRSLVCSYIALERRNCASLARVQVVKLRRKILTLIVVHDGAFLLEGLQMEVNGMRS